MEKQLLTKENRLRYKNIRGIYFIIFENTIIYIGQASDINNRLRVHEKADWQMIEKQWNREKATGVYPDRSKSIKFYKFIKEYKDKIYFIAYETCNGNELEEYFIHKYQPKYNFAGIDTKYKGI